MRTLLKWLLIAVVVAFAGLALWGYAPDRDIGELRAEYGGPSSQFVTLPGGQNIHLRDEGPRDASVILLLHGSSSSLHTWDGWARDLSKDYRIIRYDQPGHGLTGPHVAHDYTARGYSDTAAGVMHYLGIGSYVVGGNSMGGWVAWNHALDYPGKVRGLILLNASGAPDSRPTRLPIGFRLASSPMLRPIMQVFTPRSIIRSSIETTVADPSQITDETVDRYWDLIRYPGNREAVARRGDVVRKQSTPQAMAKIHVPTLIMWGAKDTLIPVSAARWFEAHIPSSSTIIYGDLGHIPMEEDAERSVWDVRGWLARAKLDAVQGKSQKNEVNP